MSIWNSPAKQVLMLKTLAPPSGAVASLYSDNSFSIGYRGEVVTGDRRSSRHWAIHFRGRLVCWIMQLSREPPAPFGFGETLQQALDAALERPEISADVVLQEALAFISTFDTVERLRGTFPDRKASNET